MAFSFRPLPLPFHVTGLWSGVVDLESLLASVAASKNLFAHPPPSYSVCSLWIPTNFRLVSLHLVGCHICSVLDATCTAGLWHLALRPSQSGAIFNLVENRVICVCLVS